MPTPTSSALALALIAALGSACAPVAGNVARGVTRETTETALSELSQPESTGQIAEIVGDPRIADASAALIARVVETLLEALTSDEARTRLTSLIVAITDAMMRAAARALERDVGPALAKVLREDLTEGAATTLEDERLRAAVGATVRTVAREAVLGADRGIDRTMERPGSATRQLSETASAGVDLARLATIGLGLAVLALGLALAYLVVRARRARAEAERREAAMLLLATAIKGAEDRPWAGEMLDLVRTTLRDSEGAEPVRELLRRDPNLRMRREPGRPSGEPTAHH